MAAAVLCAAALGGLTGTTPVAADGNEAPRAPAIARSIAAGGTFTCTLSVTGVVRCFGDGASGQLGNGSPNRVGDQPGEMGEELVPVDLGTGRKARAISAGESHACAVLENGELKCWGNNSRGQLGLGDTVNRGAGPNQMGDALPTVNLGPGVRVRAVSAGARHTCVILRNWRVNCWGENNNAETGRGDVTPPLDVVGDDPSEMGTTLPDVNLGSWLTARAITAGRDQTCALLAIGQVKCWGYNASNQLGIGDNSGALQTIGDEPYEMGNQLAAVDLGTGRTATAVTTASEFTCALLDNGQVKCWGSNQFGKTGAGIGIGTSGGDPADMGDALLPLDLGTGRTARSLSAGNDHVCVTLDNGQVKCWGRNHNGQLGLGDTTNRGDQILQMGEFLPPVDLGTGHTALTVTTGDVHSCAVLDDATATCWGYGFFGQLGRGTNASLGGTPGQMGDALGSIDLTEELGFVVRRPNAFIRLKPGSYVGGSTYNSTGVGQTRSGRVRPGDSLVFEVRVQNDGDTRDILRVTGLASTENFRVVYRFGDRNITKRVRAGTWSTGKLAPRRFRLITITVTPTTTAVSGDRVTRAITVRSDAEPTLRDTVKLKVRRR